MIEASCYYIHYRHYTSSKLITFIRYDEFMKIYLNDNKPVILYYNDILNDEKLFQYYFISLILTKDKTKVYKLTSLIDDDDYDSLNNIKNKELLTIIAHYDWKRMHYITNIRDTILFKKDPFKKNKPKRVSSDKKIRKFIKKFNEFYEFNKESNTHYFPNEPDNLDLFDSYLYKEFIADLDEIECDIERELNFIYKIKKIALLLGSEYKIPIDIVRKINIMYDYV